MVSKLYQVLVDIEIDKTSSNQKLTGEEEIVLTAKDLITVLSGNIERGLIFGIVVDFEVDFELTGEDRGWRTSVADVVGFSV